MPPPESQNRATEKRQTILLGGLLFLVTMILYWPAVSSGFCLLDDGQYVTGNPQGTNGFSFTAIKWAFTSNYAANWHPLTWLSHTLDWTFYGDFAGGHHLTNIILHSLNTLLLFLVLKNLTGTLWPGAMVAALFGWHPLHVESVAWIAERKDVLSTFFLLLTLLAYGIYAKYSGSKIYYGLALLCFAFGLMCKPMLVTLPFLLLLLDYWPLQRFSNGAGKARTPCAPQRAAECPPYPVILEKIPFFILSAAACVETVIAQRAGEAIRSTTDVPLTLRITNVLTAYVHYVFKTIWPADLSIYYLLSDKPTIIPAIIAATFLAISIGLVWHWRAKYPWLLTGWFWFLGLLVPVIGFVQVGSQAMADRYTYFPIVGLFIMAVWSFNSIFIAGKIGPTTLTVIASVSLTMCLTLTHRQLRFWHDNVALFGRAVAVTPDNYFAEYELGVALADANDNSAAILHHRAALKLNPNYEPAQYHLGVELGEDGNWSEAAFYFSEALKRDPESAELHNDLGVALAQQQKMNEAVAEFKHAIQINPDYARPYINYGNALVQSGEPRAALTNYSTAARLDPQSTEALDRLAHVLAATGDFPKAVAAAESALSLAKAQRLDNLTKRLQTDLVAYRKGTNP